MRFQKEEADFEMIMSAIKAVRVRRAEMNVPPSKKPNLIIVTDKKDVFQSGTVYLSKLAYAGSVEIRSDIPENADKMVSAATNEASLFMPLSELVDISKEIQRIENEIQKAKKVIEITEGKLANEKFVTRAPENIVNIEREKIVKSKALIENLTETLKNLKEQ